MDEDITTALGNQHGHREILGIVEGAKEDKTGRSALLAQLKECGLSGVKLVKGMPPP